MKKSEIAFLVVVSAMLLGVFLIPIIGDHHKENWEVFKDEYCEVEWDSEMWTISEELSKDLKTTAVTFTTKEDPLLCNVAFLAVPPESMTGEVWLNQIFDTVNQQFECNNKSLNFSKTGEQTTTTMKFDYKNGNIYTTIKGVAQSNQQGVVLGLATINTDKPSPRLLEEIDRMQASAKVHTAPQNDEMLDPEGLFRTYHLKMTDESMCEVYAFREGETENTDTSLVSVLPGVTSRYWLTNAPRNVEKWMEQYTAQDMKELEGIGCVNVGLSEADSTEDKSSAMALVKYLDKAGSKKEQGEEKTAGEEKPEGELGEEPKAKTNSLRIYKVLKLTEEQALCWVLDVHLDECDSETENTAIQMMIREGVEITVAG